MARGLSTIVIAGVTFTGCKGHLLNGSKFFSPFVGSTTWANSGDAKSQIVNVGVKGNAFGIQMESVEVSKLSTLRTAIATAEAGSLLFAVNAVDGLYTVNHYCTRDYSQEEWLQHGEVSEGYVENVIIRFVSRSAV